MSKRLANAIRRKLGSMAGETLVETLVSTLIIAGVMLMLCTAIVSAARVNTSIENKDTNFNIEALTDEDKINIYVTITHLDNSENGPYAKPGYTQNGYVCYVP